MYFNTRSDMGSYPFLETIYFNERLRGEYDHIYVTFVAVEGDNRADQWEEEGELFIRLPLPYERVCTFKALEVMKEELIDKIVELDDMDLLRYVAAGIYLEEKTG